MANPNPSPATRFRPGNPGGPGRPRGQSPATRLRRAFDREAPIKGKDPGHGITYLDVMVESVVKHACRGDFKFVALAFEMLEDDAVHVELAALRAMVDGDESESSGDAAGDPEASGDAGEPDPLGELGPVS